MSLTTREPSGFITYMSPGPPSRSDWKAIRPRPVTARGLTESGDVGATNGLTVGVNVAGGDGVTAGTRVGVTEGVGLEVGPAVGVEAVIVRNGVGDLGVGVGVGSTTVGIRVGVTEDVGLEVGTAVGVGAVIVGSGVGGLGVGLGVGSTTTTGAAVGSGVGGTTTEALMWAPVSVAALVSAGARASMCLWVEAAQAPAAKSVPEGECLSEPGLGYRPVPPRLSAPYQPRRRPARHWRTPRPPLQRRQRARLQRPRTGPVNASPPPERPAPAGRRPRLPSR